MAQQSALVHFMRSIGAEEWWTGGMESGEARWMTGRLPLNIICLIWFLVAWQSRTADFSPLAEKTDTINTGGSHCHLKCFGMHSCKWIFAEIRKLIDWSESSQQQQVNELNYEADRAINQTTAIKPVQMIAANCIFGSSFQLHNHHHLRSVPKIPFKLALKFRPVILFLNKFISI